MNITRNLILLLMLCAFPAAVFAQEPIDSTNENSVEDRIETIAENTDAEIDYSSLTETLKYFRKHPINLNRTDQAELEELGLLNDIQIDNLLRHIEKNGALISLYELQSIDGFDLPTIYSILPYVKITGDSNRKTWNFNEILNQSKSTLFVRYTNILQQQTGYSPITDSALAESPNSRYLGSDYKLYTRYKFAYYNMLSFGVTAEKDYGEEFFKGSQKQGFDFYSAHFFIKDIGPLRALAVGDYALQFGQGLTFWSGLSYGKSAEAINIKKSGRGIVPYSSVNENLFLRGAAAQFDLKPFSFYAWVSRKMLDANVQGGDSMNTEEFVITSLQESGLHNTQSTIEDKDQISELIVGGRMEATIRRVKIGTTGYYTRFGQSIAPGDQLYEYYNFSGNENLNFGLDYSWIIKNANFFGEAAISKSGGKAFINGIMLSPDRLFTVSVLHRYLEPDYHVIYATALQEASTIKNEHGFYFGNELKFSRKWRFNSYVDLFSFPWLRYGVDAPSNGIEMLAQINFRPTKRAEFYARFRQENKEMSVTQEHISVLEPTIKRSYRINASFPVSESVTLKSRAEYLTYQEGTGEQRDGFLIYQDVNFRHPGSTISFNARYALFDTDTYDERIYAYENDVLYGYSIPGFYSKGSRMYLTVRWSATKHLDFWARIAQTTYVNKDVVGSGLEEIQGPSKTELKLQMRITF
ncbi:MAG: hypothetical protein A2W93_12795 [Bacteroidetes bacterium GWF2_43_63]|nr:MAG: hypothetical protein A2W94_06440 [Bacteroidetes bacterium GWE2_42_42]OFY54659.1 MAG: hypothetical protein A2W93_12795 [Bacteroidetes bacterium GWF2_43_63]HBG71833.1 hypothetical protein [Bacteroidales bacterium]HCB61416.1 hypothetical protein [Bacteroidales bacterium]HCY23349.1 hypothetical protein [Bacteroidales bacterium]